MITLIHSYGKEAVFHRAFDCAKDAYATMETLKAHIYSIPYTNTGIVRAETRKRGKKNRVELITYIIVNIAIIFDMAGVGYHRYYSGICYKLRLYK